MQENFNARKEKAVKMRRGGGGGGVGGGGETRDRTTTYSIQAKTLIHNLIPPFMLLHLVLVLSLILLSQIKA